MSIAAVVGAGDGTVAVAGGVDGVDGVVGVAGVVGVEGVVVPVFVPVSVPALVPVPVAGAVVGEVAAVDGVFDDPPPPHALRAASNKR
jgi:hypothetical protein